MYLFVFYIFSLLHLLRGQWIDPYDMNVDPKNIESQTDSQDTTQHESCSKTCNYPMDHVISHYKRTIKLLLEAVIVDRTDKFNYKGHLHVNIPIESYDFLRDFVRGSKQSSSVLNKVDSTLSKILIKPMNEHLSDVFISWTDHIYFSFYNRTTGILCGCLLVAVISYKLLRAKWTIWAVVKHLVFLGWVTDFAFTWISLIQDAEINKMADSIRYNAVPVYCDPTKMSVWQYFWYSISSEDECRKHHHIVYKDQFWAIAPLKILSHQLGVIIVTPATNIGNALGYFTSALFRTLPWGMNIILLPVMLMFSIIIVCIILSFLTETNLQFNLLHMIQFKFEADHRRLMNSYSFSRDSLSGNNIRKIIDLAHRTVIEDVKDAETSDEPVNTKRENNVEEHGMLSFHDKAKILEGAVASNSDNNEDCTGVRSSCKEKKEKSELNQLNSEHPDCTLRKRTLKHELHNGSGDYA